MQTFASMLLAKLAVGVAEKGTEVVKETFTILYHPFSSAILANLVLAPRFRASTGGGTNCTAEGGPKFVVVCSLQALKEARKNALEGTSPLKRRTLAHFVSKCSAPRHTRMLKHCWLTSRTSCFAEHDVTMTLDLFEPWGYAIKRSSKSPTFWILRQFFKIRIEIHSVICLCFLIF